MLFILLTSRSQALQLLFPTVGYDAPGGSVVRAAAAPQRAGAAAEDSTTKVTLMYGSRSEEDILLWDEIEAMAEVGRV